MSKRPWQTNAGSDALTTLRDCAVLMTELAPGPCANPAATRKERQAAPARAIRTNWGNLMGGRGIWAVAGLKPNSNAANLYICRDPGRIRAEQQSTGPRNGPFLNRH